jgi:spore maturation protein CgeB
MHIFYACDHELIPGSRVWHNNLYLPLRDLGHRVTAFDYDLTRHFLEAANPAIPTHKVNIKAWCPRLEEALVRQVETVHAHDRLDMLFSYFYGAFCRPEVIRHIRSLGIVTVNWYCNGSFQFDLVREIAPAFDYCLVPERFRLEDYRRIGATPIYCQEAANPNICRPFQVAQEFDVTFVGQCYGDRPEYIHALRGAGIDVRVWGMNWRERYSEDPQTIGSSGPVDRPIRRWIKKSYRHVQKILPFLPPTRLPWGKIRATDCGAPLTDEEQVKMYSRSRINLGFSTCGETHLGGERIVQVRLRDFEVPMSGGFYMVEHMKELEEFFDIGKEVVCYHDAVDLADKVRFYLRRANERERIRVAGRSRCLRDHTWQRRLADSFRAMGMPGSG